MSTVAAGGWILIRLAGSVVVVPLVEELAFRGYLQRRLIAADFEKVSGGPISPGCHSCVTSAAFAALHSRWLAGGIAGILFSLAAYRRGQLADCRNRPRHGQPPGRPLCPGHGELVALVLTGSAEDR